MGNNHPSMPHSQAVALMADAAPVMIWLSDVNGQCLHLNKRLLAFWGIRNEDLASFDWTSTMHPDDALRVGPIVAEAVGAKRGFSVEARYRNHAGQYRILRTDAEPTIEADGTHTGFIGVNIDVTEEAEATAALRRSEERFARFMAHLPGLAWIKDEAGRYIFANQAAAAAFGTSIDQLVGRTDDELFSPEIAATFKANDADARANPGGIRVIETLPQSDGLHHSIVGKFAIPAGSEGVMTGGVAIDITDQKAAEDHIWRLNEDLRHQLEEREALLASLPVGVFIARDAACTQITMNAAGAALLPSPHGRSSSMSRPEGMGLRTRELGDTRERTALDLLMQRAAQLGQQLVGEDLDVPLPEGGTISLHASATPLFGVDGKVRGCVGVFVDITERKKSERQKSLLVDELNHRAKNMLAIVQSIAKQTLRQTSDPEAFSAAYSRRLDALARAHALLTSTTWQGAPLEQLASDALAPFAGVQDRVAIERPPVLVNPNIAVTLCLVLHELATNAVKHGALGSEGGRLHISWSPDKACIALVWRESCAFRLVPPTRKGFGSRLIAASAAQLGGSTRLDYRPDGLVASITFALAESP